MPFCEERHGAIKKYKKSWAHEGPSKIKKQKNMGTWRSKYIKSILYIKIIAPWSQMLSCGGQS